MDLKLVLADGSEIAIIEAGIPQHYVVSCESKAAFCSIWDKMTDENLAVIRVVSGNETIQRFTNSTLSGVQAAINSDGTLTGHFYLKGGYSQMDTEYTEAGKILLGEA